MSGYSTSTYTVKLTSNCCVQVVSRSEGTVFQSVSLASQNVQIVLDDDTSDFTIVGTMGQEGEYISQLNPNPNDMDMTTDGELVNIGQGASIELEVFNCYMVKSGDVVKFYEAEKETASNTGSKAA